MDFLVSIPAKIDEPDHVVRAETGGNNPMTFARDIDDVSSLVGARV
jgi:hypothetical protein